MKVVRNEPTFCASIEKHRILDQHIKSVHGGHPDAVSRVISENPKQN